MLYTESAYDILHCKSEFVIYVVYISTLIPISIPNFVSDRFKMLLATAWWRPNTERYRVT